MFWGKNIFSNKYNIRKIKQESDKLYSYLKDLSILKLKLDDTEYSNLKDQILLNFEMLGIRLDEFKKESSYFDYVGSSVKLFSKHSSYDDIFDKKIIYYNLTKDILDNDFTTLYDYLHKELYYSEYKFRFRIVRRIIEKYGDKDHKSNKEYDERFIDDIKYAKKLLFLEMLKDIDKANKDSIEKILLVLPLQYYEKVDDEYILDDEFKKFKAINFLAEEAIYNFNNYNKEIL